MDSDEIRRYVENLPGNMILHAHPDLVLAIEKLVEVLKERPQIELLDRLASSADRIEALIDRGQATPFEAVLMEHVALLKEWKRRRMRDE